MYQQTNWSQYTRYVQYIACFVTCIKSLNLIGSTECMYILFKKWGAQSRDLFINPRLLPRHTTKWIKLVTNAHISIQFNTESGQRINKTDHLMNSNVLLSVFYQYIEVSYKLTKWLNIHIRTQRVKAPINN